jgi:hypothetical protein
MRLEVSLGRLGGVLMGESVGVFVGCPVETLLGVSVRASAGE